MKKILLIEDNEEVRENTSEILSLADYEVITAENGKIGVEKAQNEHPDLIICDIMMPVLDGYGVLHILSKSSKTANIPFIFLSAKTDRADVRKGMNLGADDYLTKPFDDVELMDAIESRFKKHEIMKKEFGQDLEGIEDFIREAKSLEDLKDLSTQTRTRFYKKKNTIFLEGDVPNFLLFINSGKVKTYKANEDGKELITGLFKEGDFIGYHALISGSAHRESAMTMEDTEICLIPKTDFFSLLFNNRDVANKFIKILSNNILEKEEQLLHLAYNSVRQRVAEALIQLMEKYSANDAESFSVSREDLANIVGTAPESVIRTLSDFKDEGCIAIESGKITITDRDKLKRIITWNY